MTEEQAKNLDLGASFQRVKDLAQLISEDPGNVKTPYRADSIIAWLEKIESRPAFQEFMNRKG